MDRVTQRFGAESKDLDDLILSMLFGAFRPPGPENRDSCCGKHLNGRGTSLRSRPQGKTLASPAAEKLRAA
jgi:hypothetical protein